ncbi:hypothetical protein Fcan01_05414 [Folsomia candida]|uniref:Uncharacterized protein n=1 Tax=Folsomia candida TaxID=158441 RepID=A0A226EUB3_FOLCA|nr:hypothetical protein Fcan01_05414 [Folsomia candida]
MAGFATVRLLFFAYIFGIILLFRAQVENAPLNDESKPPCVYVANMESALKKAFANCKNELHLTDVPDLHAPMDILDEYYKNMVKNGFDDKLTLDGKTDLKAVEKLYQGGNLTDAIRKDLVKEWDICNMKIEKDFPGGGDESKICRKVAAIDNCLFSKSQELNLVS